MLLQVMRALGVRRPPLKALGGWLLEKAGRLKTNGHLVTRAPACVGTACHPADGEDRDALHRHADRELYRAKRLGAAGPRITDARGPGAVPGVRT